MTYISLRSDEAIMEEAHLAQIQALAVWFSLDEESHSRDQYMRGIFAKRREQGDFYHLVKELELANDELYFNYTRMTPTLLENLLQMVGPMLTHRMTHRIPIGEKERLVMTIR